MDSFGGLDVITFIIYCDNKATFSYKKEIYHNNW